MTDENTRLQLYRDLGNIESSLKSLTRSIDAYKAEANDSRGRIHSAVEKIAVRVVDLETKTEQLRQDMNDMQPLAAEARRWRERGIGAALGFSAMGALFGGFFATFGDRVMAFFGFGK